MDRKEAKNRQRLEQVKQKCQEELSAQRNKEKSFLKKLKDREDKIHQLQQKQMERVKHIMEDNMRKAKIKRIMDLREQEEIKEIGDKLTTFESVIERHVK